MPLPSGFDINKELSWALGQRPLGNAGVPLPGLSL